MNLSNIPTMLEDVSIKYLGKTQNDENRYEYLENHEIEFKYGSFETTIDLNLPILLDDGRIYDRENYYYPIPCIAKPFIISNDGKKTVLLKNILTDFINTRDYDVSFTYNTKSHRMDTIFQGRKLFRKLSDYELRRFVMSTYDRTELNAFLSLDIKEHHLTRADLSKLEDIICDEHHALPTTEWKQLDKMRICHIDKMISMAISISFPRALSEFKTTGNVHIRAITGAVSGYFRESSQVQFDDTHTEIATMALRNKLALPIGGYDGINAAEPHPSWYGIIDSVNTPQSEKCGAVVSRCDGVIIRDNKFIRTNNSIYSSIMLKAMQFPQFLKTHRQVMVSAAAKQCCTLGKDGEYNELPTVRTANCEHIPEIEGRQVLLALMDWNLYTHEDACVISSSLASKMSTFKDITNTFVDAEGIPELTIEIGSEIRPNAFIGFHINEEPLIMQNKINGTITDIKYFKDNIDELDVDCVAITVSCEYTCKVGSKLSNMHSCKSIVSKILPDERMPQMPTGEPVEMIISPMSVGNRVNPSLLMEGMFGMYAKHINNHMEIEQFDTDITFDMIAEYLESIGLPGECTFKLKNGTEGKLFEYPTFVGNVFVSRLHHHADEKLLSQNKVINDHNGMPVTGIGNTKYGREEVEILFQHGCNGILDEVLDNSKNTSSNKLIPGILKAMGYTYIKGD